MADIDETAAGDGELPVQHGQAPFSGVPAAREEVPGGEVSMNQ